MSLLLGTLQIVALLVIIGIILLTVGIILVARQRDEARDERDALIVTLSSLDKTRR